MAIYPLSEGSPENPVEHLLKAYDARFAPVRMHVFRHEVKQTNQKKEHRWTDDEAPANLDGKTDVWQMQVNNPSISRVRC